MRSPKRGYELRRLEGEATSIWNGGDRLVVLGEQMESTADTLRTIGDSSVHCSKGTDQLAEMATETAADLAAAAARYKMTGRTLRTYGTAQGVAQDWIHPRISDIEAAELAYESAKQAQADAASELSALDRVLPWEDEPTNQQRTSASTDASQATTALLLAKDTRDGLWEDFETRFSTWSDAYDDAVDGIQNAMDTAGNNDGRWELLGNVLDGLSWVIVGLSFIALVIGAPLFGAIGLILLGLTALVLALTLLQFAFGKATLSDVAWAAASLVPFGLGKLLSKGAPVLSRVLQSGRGAVTTAIRSSLPPFRLLRPTTWSSPIRSMLAPMAARSAVPHPGLFANPLRSMALGSSEVAQVERVLSGIRTTPWFAHPSVTRFVNATEASLPSQAIQNTNRAVWTFFTGSDVTDLGGIRPDVPLLDEVRIR